MQNASSQDAYTVAQTISDFLRLGNTTKSSSLYHTPVSTPVGQDITTYVLDSGIGQCKDYNTAFVTMATPGRSSIKICNRLCRWSMEWRRIYSLNQDYTSWGEVKLSFDSGNGLIDLGWIPFDSCPPSENLTILNQSLSPLTMDRDLGR